MGESGTILDFKNLKFYIVVIATIVLLAAILGLLSNSKSDEPDLSLLNIDNFLSTMATGGEITVEIEGSHIFKLSPNSELLDNFEQEKWKEKKGNDPLGISESLKIILQDEYYIKFYSYDEYFATIYNEDIQEKYRYYKIPKDVYMNLKNYVLKNGISEDEDLSDTWIQNPSKDPIEVVKGAIGNQIEKEYTISVKFVKAVVDDKETQRKIKSYKGSELAERRGWSDSYIMEHFLIVKASYYVEYDHEKTFMNDGNLQQYFYLTRDTDTGLWSIIDNSSSIQTFIDSGGAYKNEKYGFTFEIMEV